jgi:hypothetical protein
VGLRTLAVVALAAALGWLVFRAVVTRRVPWVTLVVVVALLVPLFVTERQWISAEQRFARVARVEAPGTVGVHCQRFGETLTYAGSELGHVDFDEEGLPTGPAFLSYGTCQDLTAYLGATRSQRDEPPIEQVIAVHVLSHEISHLIGTPVESSAECWAMQRDAKTAQLLGATAAQGRALAVRYWNDVYDRMSDEYLSDQCRPRGTLDRTPDDNLWP